MSPYKNVKKVRREKNSHQSLRYSTGNSFGDVPFDIALDILMKLPVKSMVRFLLVSKFWSETIQSRHFIKSFQIRSSLQQPRLLVMFTDLCGKRDSQDSYFFSVSVSTSSSTTTASYLSRVTYPHSPAYCSHYVNGLINLGSGRKQCVANPSTGTCPVVPGEKTDGAIKYSFLGYDPVNDEYKILACFEKMRFSSHRKLHESYLHHQVATLGAKDEQWRSIDYETDHHYHLVSSVCIDGVLYYVARTGSRLSQMSLMRFSLESENLDLVTSLSPEVRVESLYGSTLISYTKKVALATKISDYGYEVWVLDQHRWVKKSFSISYTVDRNLFIRGSTLTGEFILAPRVYSDIFCVIHYNPDTNYYLRTDVEVEGDYGFKHPRIRETEAMVFPDYVDCLRIYK